MMANWCPVVARSPVGPLALARCCGSRRVLFRHDWGAITGLLAFLGMSTLAAVHQFLTRPVLVLLVSLHVVGALRHHCFLRDDVLMRMWRLQRK